MPDVRTSPDDAVRPTEIEHRCDEMCDGNRLIQRYNYIVYHFENGGRYFWARAYLDDAGKVALYGPFGSRDAKQSLPGALDEDVLAYLRRRFRKVETLSGGGYVTVR